MARPMAAYSNAPVTYVYVVSSCTGATTPSPMTIWWSERARESAADRLRRKLARELALARAAAAEKALFQRWAFEDFIRLAARAHERRACSVPARALGTDSSRQYRAWRVRGLPTLLGN